MKNLAPNELNFEKFLIREYLRLGSINKVFQKHRYRLPISFASFDRLLTKYQIIKSAGPNSQFTESLYLLSLLANYKIPLERLYHEHAPRSIQVSTNTLHRILHYTRLGLTRRQGAILIITPEDKPHTVLVGHDMSLSVHSIMGKKGDITLPMGHTKIGEPIQDSIARILQTEVFSQAVIDQQFPWQIIPKHITPLMNINLTDIRVSVYHLILPTESPSFSSFKLEKLRFTDIKNLNFQKTRPGVKEVLEKYLSGESFDLLDVPTINSDLNKLIYALAEDRQK